MKNKENTENLPKEKNVNVELIELGLATYISPRLDDDVSKYLDSYQTADKTSKEKKVGIHSIKYPGNPNYSDLIAANKTKNIPVFSTSIKRRVICFLYKFSFFAPPCVQNKKLVNDQGQRKNKNLFFSYSLFIFFAKS